MSSGSETYTMYHSKILISLCKSVTDNIWPEWIGLDGSFSRKLFVGRNDFIYHGQRRFEKNTCKRSCPSRNFSVVLKSMNQLSIVWLNILLTQKIRYCISKTVPKGQVFPMQCWCFWKLYKEKFSTQVSSAFDNYEDIRRPRRNDNMLSRSISAFY